MPQHAASPSRSAAQLVGVLQLPHHHDVEQALWLVPMCAAVTSQLPAEDLMLLLLVRLPLMQQQQQHPRCLA
jgi:hypothetical protein